MAMYVAVYIHTSWLIWLGELSVFIEVLTLNNPQSILLAKYQWGHLRRASIPHIDPSDLHKLRPI